MTKWQNLTWIVATAAACSTSSSPRANLSGAGGTAGGIVPPIGTGGDSWALGSLRAHIYPKLLILWRGKGRGETYPQTAAILKPVAECMAWRNARLPLCGSDSGGDWMKRSLLL